MSTTLEAAIARVVRDAGRGAGAGASAQARTAEAWRQRWQAPGAERGRSARTETVAAGVEPAGEALDGALEEGADRCASAWARTLEAIGVRADKRTRASLARSVREDTERWMRSVASERTWCETLDAIAAASGEHPVGGLTLERVAALTEVPRATWGAVGRWPWWARALALRCAGAERLSKGRSAALADVLERRAPSDATAPTSGARAMASLDTWPFEWALPPLAVVGLVAREGVAPIKDKGAWGGAVRLEREAKAGRRVGGARRGEGTRARAERVRRTIGEEGARVRSAMAGHAARWRAGEEIDGDEREAIERAWTRTGASRAGARYAPALVEDAQVEGGVAWRIDHDRVGHVETVCGLRGQPPAAVAGGSAATLVRLVPASIGGRGPVLEEVGHVEHARYDPRRGERTRAAFGR